jgi:DNA mismatch repair protein MutS
VQVAKLAGLPRSAVARAGQILKKLEAGPAAAESLPLFAMVAEDPAPEISAENSALIEALDAADPDSLTPREALDLVYRLKALSQGS